MYLAVDTYSFSVCFTPETSQFLLDQWINLLFFDNLVSVCLRKIWGCSSVLMCGIRVMSLMTDTKISAEDTSEYSATTVVMDNASLSLQTYPIVYVWQTSAHRSWPP